MLSFKVRNEKECDEISRYFLSFVISVINLWKFPFFSCTCVVLRITCGHWTILFCPTFFIALHKCSYKNNLVYFSIIIFIIFHLCFGKCFSVFFPRPTHVVFVGMAQCVRIHVEHMCLRPIYTILTQAFHIPRI